MIENIENPVIDLDMEAFIKSEKGKAFANANFLTKKETTEIEDYKLVRFYMGAENEYKTSKYIIELSKKGYVLGGFTSYDDVLPSFCQVMIKYKCVF